MRKLLLFLTVLMLALPCASAVEAPYDDAAVLSVLDLTAAQHALAEFLYPHILAGEARISLPPGTPYEDVGYAMRRLMQDFPELFHLGRDYTVGYYQRQPDIATYVAPTYRLDAETAAAWRSELYAEAQRMASVASSALGLHDLLLARVTYGGDEQLRHTAAGALLQGQATCEGYAQALSLLFRMAGVPCGVVTGTAADGDGASVRHSWNIADIAGPMLIDPTWNDQDALALNTHWYYGLSTEQMGQTHLPDVGQTLPPCTDHAEWHRAQGLLIQDKAGAYKAVRRFVLEGGPLTLRFADAALYAEITGDLNAFLEAYNASAPDAPFYGEYTYIVDRGQRCLILWDTE